MLLLGQGEMRSLLKSHERNNLPSHQFERTRVAHRPPSAVLKANVMEVRRSRLRVMSVAVGRVRSTAAHTGHLGEGWFSSRRANRRRRAIEVRLVLTTRKSCRGEFPRQAHNISNHFQKTVSVLTAGSPLDARWGISVNSFDL
jgi:hypothetical protein